jgi:perosamine synthetase
MIKQFEPISRRKDARAVYKTIRRGNLGPGEVCLELEEQIKQLTGAKYCLTTTSGTTALIMAIEALDLPKGSTILFPAYTFLAGANAARFMGYKVKLVDINQHTLCIDRWQLKKKINKDVSCVIFVNHNANNSSYINTIRSLCDENNIPLIEDSCQSIGVKKAGRTGNIGMFSFSVPKLITGGQGGAIITDDDKLAKRLAEIRDHGDNWRKNRIHKNIGVNFRYNDIQASYVLSQLNDIQELLTKRWMLCNEYSKYINIESFDCITFSNETPWMVIYKSKNADKIIEALAEKKIQAVKYYRSINENKPYKTKSTFPNAEEAANQLIYLPSSLNLNKRQIKRICNIILKVENNE